MTEEILNIDGYKCEVFSLGTDGTTLRLLIYLDKHLKGVWGFLSSATMENIKKFVSDKVVEIKQRKVPFGYYIRAGGIIWDLNKLMEKEK